MPDGDACFHLRFFELLQRAGLSHSNEAAAKALSGPLEWARRDGSGPLTKQYVAKWKNGEVVPNADTLCALADFFGVSTDYLLGRSSDGVPNFAVALARHVQAQLLSRSRSEPWYGGPFPLEGELQPARLLPFVVEAVAAAQAHDDAERDREHRSTMNVNALHMAGDLLQEAGKRTLSRLMRKQAADTTADIQKRVVPRLFMLRVDVEDAPLPSFRLDVAGD